MKDKVYIVYNKYTDDLMKLNDYNDNIDFLKVFTNEVMASNYALDEAKFQCDNNEGWSYKLLADGSWTMKYIAVFYEEEKQYDIVVREMVVE